LTSVPAQHLVKNATGNPNRGNSMNTSKRRGISAAFVILATSLSVAAPRVQAQVSSQRRPAPAPARAQSAGNAGTVSGTVTDPTGAVIANATVTLSNAVSGLSRTATTDNSGAYTITNIPFNTYRLTVTAKTMAPASQTVEVQSFVPIALTTTLQIASASTVVDVTIWSKPTPSDTPMWTAISSPRFRWRASPHPSARS
jgi:hypothetical protein